MKKQLKDYLKQSLAATGSSFEDVASEIGGVVAGLKSIKWFRRYCLISPNDKYLEDVSKASSNATKTFNDGSKSKVML